MPAADSVLWPADNVHSTCFSSRCVMSQIEYQLVALDHTSATTALPLVGPEVLEQLKEEDKERPL